MDLSALNTFSASPSVSWPSPTVRPAQVERNGVNETRPDPLNGGSSPTAEGEEREPTAGPTRPDGTPLAPEEVQQLEQLKQTDRNVRQHEMAHQIVGGPYTGGATYQYEVGPDGQRYAVAGEVPIDYGPIPGDPQATVEKMQTVIAAAMAPTDPSPKDLQVAAQARQYLLEAKLEAAMEQSEMNQARSMASDTGMNNKPPEQAA